MFEKLESLKQRFEEVERSMADPAVVDDLVNNRQNRRGV